MPDIQLDLVGRQQHRMRAMEVAAEHAEVVEILGRALAEAFQRVVDLVGALGEVGVDLDAEVARRLRHGLDEAGRADDDLAQGEPRLHAVLGAPALHEVDVAVIGLLGGHQHRRRHDGAEAVVLVDRGEGDEAADADLQCGTAHLVGMRAAGLGEARGADAQHVGVGDEAGEMHVVGGERALERNVVVLPDRDLQRPPAAEFAEFAAQELLGGVDMRVDEPGHGDAVAAVEHVSAHEPAGARGGPDPDDAAGVDGDGGVAEDGACVVHGDDVAAMDEEVDMAGGAGFVGHASALPVRDGTGEG